MKSILECVFFFFFECIWFLIREKWFLMIPFAHCACWKTRLHVKQTDWKKLRKSIFFFFFVLNPKTFTLSAAIKFTTDASTGFCSIEYPSRLRVRTKIVLEIKGTLEIFRLARFIKLSLKSHLFFFYYCTSFFSFHAQESPLIGGSVLCLFADGSLLLSPSFGFAASP